MRRAVLTALALSLVAALLPAHALAGPPIKRLAACEDQSARYSGPTDAVRFRAAVLCLMSSARKAQGLPTLARDAKLERSAQGHATSQAKSGALSHGKSTSEIPKRIARAGYKAAAVNEALGIGTGDETAYALVARMMEQFPCTQILDPRFRDAGVGVSIGKLKGAPGSNYVHIVVNFGLKATAKAPSRKTRPAATCPHALPAPGVLRPVGTGPVAQGTTATVRFTCTGATACLEEATLELVHGGATAKAAVSIGAGQSADVTFTFDAAALEQELASTPPQARLTASGRTYTAPLARG